MHDPGDALPERLRRLVFLAAWLSALAGCAGTFPQFQPDRCHRAERARETLNWDIICVQAP